MMNLNCLMDQILFRTFKIILNTLLKNRIVFKTETGYKLELLFPETMKLLGSTKEDADQDIDGEDAPKLESV